MARYSRAGGSHVTDSGDIRYVRLHRGHILSPQFVRQPTRLTQKKSGPDAIARAAVKRLFSNGAALRLRRNLHPGGHRQPRFTVADDQEPAGQ